jgi:hypothetical protein
MPGRHRARPLHRAPKSLPSRRRALRNADRRLTRVFGTWREQHWHEILQRNHFVAVHEFIRRRSVSNELQTCSATVQLISPNLSPGETQGAPTRGSPTTIAWEQVTHMTREEWKNAYRQARIARRQKQPGVVARLRTFILGRRQHAGSTGVAERNHSPRELDQSSVSTLD